ncbi:MAG: pitrilysin family protein [bacterium]|nr:pitrilysin family protein [bacterium]
MIPVTRKKLSNGMRIILAPEKDARASTVLVLVDTGSKYENKKTNGLSHFLEHMCFKGTNTRPKAIDISALLDGLGSSYNAFTGQEYTGYYAKVAPGHIHDAIDIVSDLYLNPTFPKEEIEKEKGVIVEEINMYEDMPSRKVWDLIMETLYGDQPAGWNIAGTPELVRSFTRKDFIKYREQHYVAEATTVVVAGKFDEKKVLEDIKMLFKHIPKSKKVSKKATKEIQNRPMVRIEKKKSDQTHLILGARAFDVHDARIPTLEVMAAVLGGGMSSRLFSRVRDELGLCYYIRAGADIFTDHGFLAISAGVRNDAAHDAVREIVGELKRMKDDEVSDEELVRAKESLKGRMYLGLEKSDEVAVFYGMQEVMHEKLKSPQMLAVKIDLVTARDIQELAKELFVGNKLNLALIGPQAQPVRFEKLLTL